MDELIEQMNRTLADVFAFYLKAQFFHWNVTGPDFPMYHDFFGKIYDEVYGSIDPIAEHIRAIDGFPAGSFSRFQSLTSIRDQVVVPRADAMIAELHGDNLMVLGSLSVSQRLADRYGEIGLSNFLQDRIDQHKKHGWMLKSTLRSTENE